jgi:hypothetical protein
MKANYQKAVGVFGFAIPLLFLILLISAVLVAHGRVDDTYRLRKRAFDQDLNTKRQIAQLEKKMHTEKEMLNAWLEMLAAENRRSFTEHWKTASLSFKGKELQWSLPAWKSQSAGLGKGVKQPASQVTMSFDATFRAMQIALMEMETRLPQMQLDSMSMKPNKEGRTMNFQTTFTLWTLQ